MSQAVPEIQQIPARHGTATFVPKGHVIKIINTYGKQVVDTWAFALAKPPSQEEVDEQNEEVEKAQQEGEKAAGKSPASGDQTTTKEGGEDQDTTAGAQDDDQQQRDQEDERGDGAGTPKPGRQQRAEDKGGEESNGDPNSAKKVAGSETETDTDKSAVEENPRASWSSYLPSMPRSRGKTTQAKDQEKDTTATPKQGGKQPRAWTQYLPSGSGDKDNKGKSKSGTERTWASYFPSGKSFSNYVPKNVSISAFASSPLRDPTKSYAEQLYDFSKTPVGAGALSAATGSGYAGTAYAAYQAYTKQQEAAATSPPMEYLSMSHTHSSTNHLVPKVDDTLVSNLRQPMLTIIEDTAAIHDTVIAACDPQRYRELGVEKWEQHGSCAENLVLALKEINESAGLKGPKAVGADVTVNTAPQPLNLFMNIPFKEDGQLSFEAPKGKKGEFIRLRAERDVVVVMSACPQDVLAINGHKCMAAHFVVQGQEEAQKAAPKKPVSAKQAAPTKATKKPAGQPPQETAAAAQKPAPKPQPAKPQPAKQPAQPKSGEDASVKNQSQSSGTRTTSAASAPTPRKQSTQSETPKKPQPTPKTGRPKPKKLERRASQQV